MHTGEITEPCPRCGCDAKKIVYQNSGPIVNIYCPECRFLISETEAWKKGYKRIFDCWNALAGEVSQTPDHKTYKIINTLMGMKNRPGMYFKSGSYYDQLQAFLYGYAVGTNLNESEDVIVWSEIANEVDRSIEKKYEGREFEMLSDQERYDSYLDVIFKTFSEQYPESAAKLGL